MGEIETTVGVIADTHGLLRPQSVAALQGCAIIIHAGDVGKPDVISGLRGLAPTVAVRGNVDTGEWAKHLPMTERIEVGGLLFFVLHQMSQLDFDPAATGIAAVAFGHSHRPSIETRNGILFLNPGSAGPRRFRLPVTVARITVSGRRLNAKIVELQVS
jgi:putative phosphoesterase